MIVGATFVIPSIFRLIGILIYKLGLFNYYIVIEYVLLKLPTL